MPQDAYDEKHLNIPRLLADPSARPCGVYGAQADARYPGRRPRLKQEARDAELE